MSQVRLVCSEHGMRGVGQALSRLPAATAFLAGAAAMLAGSGSGEVAFAQARRTDRDARTSDELAFAVPRLSLPSRLSPDSPGHGGEVALPQPLPPSEAARIRRILSLQAHGAIAAADRETQQLDVTSLLGQAMLGYIMADRYLGRFTHPGVAELSAWLTRWPDLPDASAIHALLIARLPHNLKSPAAPLSVALPALLPVSPRVPPVPEETGASIRAVARSPELDRSVSDAARRHGAASVLHLLAHTSGLTATYASLLAADAGRILFTLNRDAEAYDVAAHGARLCGREPHPRPPCETASLAGYVAGLAAWRMGQIDLAREMFDAAWHAPVTTPSLRASAAFWAARSRMAGSNPATAELWLKRAAAERDTFYGLIARRSLGAAAGGIGGDDGYARETLGQADIDAVAATAQGLRAFAMLQLGKPAPAEAELRRLWPEMHGTPSLARAIMLIADAADLPELAAQLADLLQSEDGRARDETRFRIPHLSPDGGFRIDPAMVYALARTESNFDPSMVSDAGATGMMQIMPDTANFIVGGEHRPGGSLAGSTLRAMLNDPATNLALGQRYVSYLSGSDAVDGDLIRLLASYNSGPGFFGHWGATIQGMGDPLLFIEAIPIDETRAFVPRVLTYTWIYARRLRLPTPSLDELAAGEWPRYHPLPDGTKAVRLH